MYRLLNTDPEREQNWKRYAGSIVIFSAISIGVTYLILRIQGSLPLNPQHFGAVGPALSFNTATSFVTNTNWQNYGGETTMSYFSQIGALDGPAVRHPRCRDRGRDRPGPRVLPQLVDDRQLLGRRDPVHPVHPLADRIRRRDHLRGPGRCADPFRADPGARLPERIHPGIRVGPIGFMESIKQLGNNGGGFLNANSATPFENPTGLTSFLSIYLLLSIPFALTYTFGKMVKSVRHGATLLAAMVIIFGVWVGFTSYAEHQPNPAVAAAGIHQTAGNTEGTEVRTGDTNDALFGVASTSTSTGSAVCAYDSTNPMAGFGLLTGMMLGEVTPGARAAGSTRS